MKTLQNDRSTCGFTLMELMIVVAILGIVAASTPALAAAPKEGVREAGLVYSSGEPVRLQDVIAYVRLDRRSPPDENVGMLARRVIWNAGKKNVSLDQITVVRVYQNPVSYGVWYTVIYRYNGYDVISTK